MKKPRRANAPGFVYEKDLCLCVCVSSRGRRAALCAGGRRAGTRRVRSGGARAVSFPFLSLSNRQHASVAPQISLSRIWGRCVCVFFVFLFVCSRMCGSVVSAQVLAQCGAESRFFAPRLRFFVRLSLRFPTRTATGTAARAELVALLGRFELAPSGGAALALGSRTAAKALALVPGLSLSIRSGGSIFFSLSFLNETEMLFDQASGSRFDVRLSAHPRVSLWSRSFDGERPTRFGLGPTFGVSSLESETVSSLSLSREKRCLCEKRSCAETKKEASLPTRDEAFLLRKEARALERASQRMRGKSFLIRVS